MMKNILVYTIAVLFTDLLTLKRYRYLCFISEVHVSCLRESGPAEYNINAGLFLVSILD